jgi:hypothetical protein
MKESAIASRGALPLTRRFACDLSRGTGEVMNPPLCSQSPTSLRLALFRVLRASARSLSFLSPLSGLGPPKGEVKKVARSRSVYPPSRQPLLRWSRAIARSELTANRQPLTASSQNTASAFAQPAYGASDDGIYFDSILLRCNHETSSDYSHERIVRYHTAVVGWRVQSSRSAVHH